MRVSHLASFRAVPAVCGMGQVNTRPVCAPLWRHPHPGPQPDAEWNASARSIQLRLADALSRGVGGVRFGVHGEVQVRPNMSESSGWPRWSAASHPEIRWVQGWLQPYAHSTDTGRHEVV